MSIESISGKLGMMNGVKPIDPALPKGGDGIQPSQGPKSFSDFLSDQLKEVNELSLDADNRLQHALTYGDPNPHQTMIALQKADISFRLLMSVKERVVQAYQQVVRMQM